MEIVKINNNNRDIYKESFLNIKLLKRDITEIEEFGVLYNKEILEIIYNIDDLYLVIDKGEIILFFGLEIDGKIGRPFILQSEKFNIKKHSLFVLKKSINYLKEFKRKTEILEVYKPINILDDKVDNFLFRLSFRVLTEETYKIDKNYFIKYIYTN